MATAYRSGQSYRTAFPYRDAGAALPYRNAQTYRNSLPYGATAEPEVEEPPIGHVHIGPVGRCPDNRPRYVIEATVSSAQAPQTGGGIVTTRRVVAVGGVQPWRSEGAGEKAQGGPQAAEEEEALLAILSAVAT